MEFIHEDYLGDGVYAQFDGYAIWLKANDIKNPSDQICLDPSVVSALIRFNSYCEEIVKNVHQEIDEQC